MYVEWWERYGLSSDPYSGIHGIARKNPHELTEDDINVIYKTSLFLRYDKFIQNPEMYYNNCILISGEFGSGKTTFFEYLEFYLKDKNVRSIRIDLGKETDDLDSLCKDFYESILFDLDIDEITNVTDKTTISKLRNRLVDDTKINSYCFFIDELHKNKNDDVVLQFIKYLQSFLDMLKRKNVFITIFIAGHILWEEKFSDNPIYDRAFNVKETLEELPVDVILEILNRRWNHFIPLAKYRDMYKLSAVQRMKEFTDINSLSRYFQLAQKAARNLPSEKIYIESPDIQLEIDEITLNKIKTYIRANPTVNMRLNDSIGKLTQGEEIIDKKLKIICTLYDNKEITYGFQENLLDQYGIYESQKCLRMLKNEEVITPSINNKFWRIRKKVNDLFEQIHDRFYARPSDYLSSTFVIGLRVIEDDISKNLNQTISKLSLSRKLPNSRKLLSKCHETHQKIEYNMRFREPETRKERVNLILENLHFSIIALEKVRTYNDESEFDRPTMYSKIEGISESLDEYFSEIKKYENLIDIYENHLMRLHPLYISAMEEVTRIILDKIITGKTFIDCSSPYLSESDIETIEQIESLLSSGENIEARDLLIKNFYKKLRRKLFEFGYLNYGKVWYEYFPRCKTTLERISKIKDPDYQTPKSILEEFNEKGLEEFIFTTTRKNSPWDNIFCHVIGYTDDEKNIAKGRFTTIRIIRQQWAHVKNTYDVHNRLNEALFNFQYIVKQLNKGVSIFFQTDRIYAECKKEKISVKYSTKDDVKYNISISFDYTKLLENLEEILKNKIDDNIEIVYADKEIEYIDTLREKIGLLAFLCKNNLISYEEYKNEKLSFHINGSFDEIGVEQSTIKISKLIHKTLIGKRTFKKLSDILNPSKDKIEKKKTKEQIEIEKVCEPKTDSIDEKNSKDDKKSKSVDNKSTVVPPVLSLVISEPSIVKDIKTLEKCLDDIDKIIILSLIQEKTKGELRKIIRSKLETSLSKKEMDKKTYQSYKKLQELGIIRPKDTIRLELTKNGQKIFEKLG